MRGFTLTELLVSITIFVLIAGAVVANLRGGSSGRQLRLQADNVVSLMRNAQVQSLVGDSFNNGTPVGGFGVHLATCSAPPCSVQLFADENSDFMYQSSELVEEITLGNATVENTSEGDPLNIAFKPPRPFICFNAVCSGIDTATITLGLESGNQTTEITVNQVSGRISTEE